MIKWKTVTIFDMTIKSPFGYWLDKNYISNDKFPKAPLEFDSKTYNYSKWYGIDYLTGGYANKSVLMTDKLWYENPHFKFEEFITESYKNNNLIYPNIANFKFLFDDSPASPFEYKKYSLNRYYGFYVDFELIKTLTPYRSKKLKDNLKIQNNIFMDIYQVSGSTNPFNITWDDSKNYYVYAINNLYKVIRINTNGQYYYKILSDIDIKITDITRDNEIDIVFSDLGNYEYSNEILPRTQQVLYIDKMIDDNGVEDLCSDLYMIEIDNKYHVIEKSINEFDGLLEHYIRTDYGISCDDNILKYWLGDKTKSTDKNVEDVINNEVPITFPIYKIKFRDIKDFDFDRVETSYANFDFDKKDEYVETTEPKLYATELRDASLSTVFKTYDKTDIRADKVINVSSEYISTDELFEITKQGLSNIWHKNQSIVKWGFKNSISHSDYPYKLNNNNKVGSMFNKTSNIFSKSVDVTTKTNEYFYRIGDYYKSQNEFINKQYYSNQTLSIETEKLKTNYFNLDEYVEGNFDYFDYFFKNIRCIDSVGNYEQTTHYSIFNNDNNSIPSTTLFKGVKYNIHKLNNLIRDNDTDLIKQFIVDNTNNYNGYKFSIILNSIYSDVSNITVQDTNNYLDKNNNINIFVNDKYENILVIVNCKFDSIGIFNSTLNDVTYFDEREGIYSNKTKTLEYKFNYNPELLTAKNFISALNNLNDLNSFDNYVSYYYINKYNEFGYSKINGDNRHNALKPLRNITTWNNDFPPIVFECDIPNTISVKKNSFVTSAIKGPKYNIYDKYKIDFNETIYDKSFIKEPLSRVISINEKELSPDVTINKDLQYSNNIFRYNGAYEPIFKDIELFSPISYNKIEEQRVQYIKTYITEKILSLEILLSEAVLVNDIDVINKLNNDIGFYTNYILALPSYSNSIDNYRNFNDNSRNFNDIQPIFFGGNTYNWTYKDNALGLCDGNYASCELIMKNSYGFIEEVGYSGTATSELLNINNFGFNIPIDSNITSIDISIYKRSKLSNNYTNVKDNIIQIRKPDGNISNNVADLTTPWLTSSTQSIYTIVSAYTALEINNKNFGIEISVNANVIPAIQKTIVNIAYIDCVCVTVNYTVSGVETGKTHTTFIDRNTKFDTSLYNFGEISELQYSKVNEIENPLKLKNTEEDISIYPMVDEFGLSYDKRFIFKSSWDNDYYTRTKNEII